MSASARIVLIGFGNMGQALVRGWLADGRPANTVKVVDPLASAVTAAAQLGVEAQQSLEAVTGPPADVLVLAVKPNHVAAVVPLAERLAAPGSTFLSIAAGKTIAQISAGLRQPTAVVRAMPNTPAAIGQGMTALVANGVATAVQRALCTELLSAVGAVAWLDDERHMDAVTAVSGSGPAYVFLLVECLERAGIEAGLAPALAQQLALATVAGAGSYAAAAGVTAAELRRRVTSPNGTTQAALDVLLADVGLQKLISQAVRAAAERSRELSRV